MNQYLGAAPRPFFRTAAALCALAPVAAVAQQPQPQPQPQARWNVDWGAQHCTLSRSPAPGVPITFGLRIVPGTENRQLILMSEAWQEPPFANGTGVGVTLGTAAAAIEPVLRAGRRGNSRFIVLERLGADLLDRLSAASEIRVMHGDRQVAVPLPGAREAVAALRACESDALRAWGIDQAALAALRERPRSDGSWLSHLNYPEQAVRTNASGLVVVRFSVDARGRTTECAVVGSSGNRHLDDATCRAGRRAAFTPAIGADGQPTAARFITYVRWWIAD